MPVSYIPLEESAENPDGTVQHKKLEESFEKEGALEVNAYQIPFEKNYLLELLK